MNDTQPKNDDAALVRAEDVLPALQEDHGTVSIAKLKAQKGAVQRLLREVLVRGKHYGPLVLPRSGKVAPDPEPGDFLYQPGAESLANMFKLRPEYEILEQVSERTEQGGFLAYVVRCRLYYRPNGLLVGEDLGACNSREKKYRYKEIYPNRADEAERQAGVQVEKQGRDGPYVMLRVPVDPWEIQHTILSMARKRSRTAAVRSAIAASDALKLDPDQVEELVDAHVEDRATVQDGGAATEAVKDRAKGELLRRAAALAREVAVSEAEVDAMYDECARIAGKEKAGPKDLTSRGLRSLVKWLEARKGGGDDAP